jgi:nucleotide-binding universal stress UspA family protein
VIEHRSSDATPPVVVATNAARRCAETLELATALAASVGADLEVVFVEDADLLRLADVPVTREIDRISGRSRELDARRMLRALHGEARQLRQELARIGRASSIRSTLRVVRGHYLTEALAASASVELTFVHSARRPLPGEHLPSAGGRPLATGETPGRTRRAAGRKPLWTLFDGSPASHRALAVAARLAGTLAVQLVVVLPVSGVDQIEARKRQVQIAAHEVALRYLVVADDHLSRLRKAPAPNTGSLLVLARKSPELEDSAARSYLESLTVPVVLVA